MGEEKITGISPLLGVGIMGIALVTVIQVTAGILLGYKMHFLFLFHAIFTVILVLGLIKSE